MSNGGHTSDGGVPPSGGVPEAEERITLPRPDTVRFAIQRVYRFREIRWVTDEAYCGDEARIEAVVEHYPPRSPATINVVHVQTGATLATINATVEGGRIDATWVARAPSANWRTDTIRFRIEVPNLRITGTSTNLFSFKKRPTTEWALRKVAHPGPPGFPPLFENHDARLEADRVHYLMRLRTFGDPFPPARQLNAKSLIEGPWNGEFARRRFHRTGCGRGPSCDCPYDCCKAGFRFDVSFVAGGEHVTVEIVTSPPPPATPPASFMTGNTGRWSEPPLDEPSVYAHECGHELGQYDEYPGGGNDPTGVQPANTPIPNLMGTRLNTTLLNRHYRHVLTFLNSHTRGDRYEIIPPGP